VMTCTCRVAPPVPGGASVASVCADRDFWSANSTLTTAKASACEHWEASQRQGERTGGEGYQ
jgi:hypothetical protein